MLKHYIQEHQHLQHSSVLLPPNSSSHSTIVTSSHRQSHCVKNVTDSVPSIPSKFKPDQPDTVLFSSSTVVNISIDQCYHQYEHFDCQQNQLYYQNVASTL